MFQYLTMEDVIFLHERQLELFGGAPGLRDKGLLEAALQRPQSGYYHGLAEQAAALWESLTMNHCFVDGNKRIGLAATDVFVSINGFRMVAEEGEPATFILSMIQKSQFNKDTAKEWLDNHLQSRA